MSYAKMHQLNMTYTPWLVSFDQNYHIWNPNMLQNNKPYVCLKNKTIKCINQLHPIVG
jgi:hypothetical protein